MPRTFIKANWFCSRIDPKSQILLLDSESLSGPLFTSFVSRNRNALFEISLKTLAIRIEVCQPETFVRTENTIPGRDGFWLLDVLRIFRSIEELIFVYDPDQAYQKELHDQYVMDMKTGEHKCSDLILHSKRPSC